MSNQNNSQEEGDDMQKCSETFIATTSSADNGNEEHQTIHGNETPKNTEVESNDDNVNKDEGHVTALQSETESGTTITDQAHAVIYNMDGGTDIDGKSTLTEEEVEKKFQELVLAFRTDSMTLQQRLMIRKRNHEQAEHNVGKEIQLMKTKLNNLRCLCFDSESLEHLSDLTKHLDVIFASVNSLSGCAEAYGFVQNEEKMSGAVSIILRKIECIERLESEMSKSPDADKSDGKRIQLVPILDDERQEESVVRRRSVAALSLNGPARRRASIASVSRNSLPSDDNYPFQNASTPIRFSNANSSTVAERFSGIQSSSEKSMSPLAGSDHMHTRSRLESRMGDCGMRFVEDYDKSHGSGDEMDDAVMRNEDQVARIERRNSQLPLLGMSSSPDNRLRANSVTSETFNIINSLRNVVKWNVVVIRNSRFQFPENVHQYVPFLITWYVVLLMVTIFASGFLTGINRCFTSEMLYFCGMLSGTVTLCIAALSLAFRWKLTKRLIVTVTLMYCHSLYHTLHDEGLYAFFQSLGIRLETHYTEGYSPF